MTGDIVTANVTTTEVVTNTEKPLFELEIGPGIAKLEPRSIDEFKHWLEIERDYWAWVSQVTAKVTGIQQQIESLAGIIARLESTKQFQANGDKASYDNNLAKCQRLAEQRQTQFHALHSTDSRAKYLETIGDLMLRGHILREFLGQPFTQLNDSAALRGTFLACAFEYGIKGVPEGFEQAQRETQQRIVVEHEALRRDAGKLKDDFTEHQQAIVTLQGEQKTNYDTLAAQRTTNFQKLIDDSNAKVTDLERAFEAKTATKFAVVYFRDKGRSHWIAASILFVATLIAGYYFGAFAVEQVDALLRPPVANVALATGTTPAAAAQNAATAASVATTAAASNPSAVRIALAVLLATLGFWLLRLLVRSLLSQMHLATDCQSRATLMETYIALLKDGQGELKADDRKIILSVLFRPMSDGLIRDDAAPPGVWDLLTRNFSGK